MLQQCLFALLLFPFTTQYSGSCELCHAPPSREVDGSIFLFTALDVERFAQVRSRPLLMLEGKCSCWRAKPAHFVDLTQFW
jgi:hypothetical protein